MKLVHPDISYQIEFKENEYNVLILENPTNFTRFCQGLFEQCSGEEGRFVLSEGEEIIAITKKMYMIVDPFSLEFNQRRILNKLYAILKETAVSDAMYVRTNEMLNKMEHYILELLEQVEYPIIYEEQMDLAGIFKMAEVKVATTYDSLTEKIIDYMKIMNDICGLPICVFVNMKAYFTMEEMIKIYEYADYNKIFILLVENTERQKMEMEKRYICDKDGCEIY